ncbi:hypothetical protein TELCIR_11776 [Teladorsagia circumcincta]|uniref:Uncharacterized protein n=1 Tax=Teladorsagia circumcincta TaxID=45464 RepID=A0A2G9U8J5_TELCI|nr:hypothetical protein TELCIR_11776 [Teladorsagia circumcincta]
MMEKASSGKRALQTVGEAALKAESNFVAGGTVLKLEVQILSRLKGRPHVPQLIHSGKKELYCYMVMTLLGDTLGTLQSTLNYYSHPDYALIYNLFMEIMKAGKFKFTDPFDWEPKKEVKKSKVTVLSASTAITSETKEGYTK